MLEWSSTIKGGENLKEYPKFRAGDYAQVCANAFWSDLTSLGPVVRPPEFKVIFDCEVLEGPNCKGLFFVTGIGVTRPAPIWVPVEYMRSGNLVHKYISRRAGTLKDKSGKSKQYASAQEAAKDVLKG